MNLLAHAYLSFNEPGLLVGNMISDYVKGKKQYDYPPAIQRGIKLHRAIDTFTDDHDATRQAKAFFRADYRLYAGAMVDVVYDHFLATDGNCFATEASLQQTADFTYYTLEQNLAFLPEKFAPMLPYMRSQNWLYNYRHISGIEKSMMGVVRRSQYLTESARAFATFQQQYDELKKCYQEFFPQLKAMAEKWVAL